MWHYRLGVRQRKRKKADVAEHRKMFHHVGLLFNGPPGRGRVVLHLVIRPLLYPGPLLYPECTPPTGEMQGFHKPFEKPYPRRAVSIANGPRRMPLPHVLLSPRDSRLPPPLA